MQIEIVLGELKKKVKYQQAKNLKSTKCQYMNKHVKVKITILNEIKTVIRKQ